MRLGTIGAWCAAFDDRYVLGLGVSHPRQVDPRGHRYQRPVATMRAFLDSMDDDPFVSPDGPGATRPSVPRVLAALRPPMLRLAAEKALGSLREQSHHVASASVSYGTIPYVRPLLADTKPGGT